MGDDGMAYVEFHLQWLRYVQATMADHEFTEDWCRRMKEILVPVWSLKIEESSSEEWEQKEDRGGKRTSKVRKPKEAIETSPQKQRNPQLEPAIRKMLSSKEKSRSSLLDRKSLDEEDHKDVLGYFKSYTIQDWDIFCEKAKCIADTYDDGV